MTDDLTVTDDFDAGKVRKLITNSPVLFKLWEKNRNARKLNEEGALKALYNAVIVKTPALTTLYNRTEV